MIKPEIRMDGVLLPFPSWEGLVVKKNRIWSSNAGRNTAVGDMVGDIIASKYSVTLSYEHLTDAEAKILWNATATDVPYHILEFPAPDGNMHRATVYTGDAEYILQSWRERTRRGIYTGLTIEFVEK